MSGLVESLASFARPWADLYGGSMVVSTSVEFLHLTGLLVAGGFALAFDRATLRVAARRGSDRTGFVSELTAVHGPVVIGVAVVIVSGLALMFADIEAILPSPVFWLKMSVFALLLVNGLVIRRVGLRLESRPADANGWRSLRRASVRSIGLWVVVLFLGVVLTAAA
jgi:hypothetical protein